MSLKYLQIADLRHILSNPVFSIWGFRRPDVITNFVILLHFTADVHTLVSQSGASDMQFLQWASMFRVH